jgi:hypothetical protein
MMKFNKKNQGDALHSSVLVWSLVRFAGLVGHTLLQALNGNNIAVHFKMALLVIFSLIIIWGVIAKVDSGGNFIEWGIFIPIIVATVSIFYGLFIWFKAGYWGSVDVLTIYCMLKEQCIYVSSSYVGFDNLNKWYLSTNVAWTIALVPMLGNVFCTLVLDHIKVSKKVRVK